MHKEAKTGAGHRLNTYLESSGKTVSKTPKDFYKAISTFQL